MERGDKTEVQFIISNQGNGPDLFEATITNKEILHDRGIDCEIISGSLEAPENGSATGDITVSVDDYVKDQMIGIDLECRSIACEQDLGHTYKKLTTVNVEIETELVSEDIRYGLVILILSLVIVVVIIISIRRRKRRE